MRPAQLAIILSEEFKSVDKGLHTPVMIWGGAGIGKSRMVADIAAKHSVSMLDIRLSQMEPTDLRGIPFRQNNKVEWAIPSMLPNKKQHGERGILFLDEINSAPLSVSAAAYQLILDRKLGDYQIPDGWAIFAAGNRQGDRGVTYTMPAPLSNRFSHYELEANVDDWVAWAWQNEIHEALIGFIRFRPELLSAFDASQNLQAFPSPRSWEFANRALQKFINQPNLLRESLCACVGMAAGIELKAFVDNLAQLPDIDAILNGVETYVPEQIDLQYAVASALVGRAIKAKELANSKEIFGRILTYANNFPQKEMGVSLVSDMHRAIGKDLFAVPEFALWAKSISDVMLYE